MDEQVSSWHDVHPDYGRCPVCGRSFRKRKDGLLRQHFKPEGRKAGHCAGSFGKPDQS